MTEFSRHSRWLPDETPPEGKRLALRRLANAVRGSIDLLIETDASEEELLAATEALEAINAGLSRAPHGRPLWGFAETSTSGDSFAFYDSSPLSGPGNPLAPPISMKVVDDIVLATATFGIAYEGPPGHVHGGYVAASFDEVLGCVQSMTGNPGMTGRLIVNYRNPTPLNRELTFRGRLDRVEGRKIFTVATLHCGEMLCAEAEGLFISVGQERFRELADDTNRGIADGAMHPFSPRP
jgi:acyl-coenzyme A thioesterase PaaI-like protein